MGNVTWSGVVGIKKGAYPEYPVWLKVVISTGCVFAPFRLNVVSTMTKRIQSLYDYTKEHNPRALWSDYKDCKLHEAGLLSELKAAKAELEEHKRNILQARDIHFIKTFKQKIEKLKETIQRLEYELESARQRNVQLNERLQAKHSTINDMQMAKLRKRLDALSM